MDKKKLFAAYRDAAKRRWHRPGSVEVEPEAHVLLAPQDGGAYVRAWVWVNEWEIEEEKNRIHS